MSIRYIGFAAARLYAIHLMNFLRKVQDPGIKIDLALWWEKEQGFSAWRIRTCKKRNAKIYGEVKGYGMSVTYHITKPSEDGNGGFRAMEMAQKSLFLVRYNL